MACSCSGGGSVSVQPQVRSSISPCACKGQLSSVSRGGAAASYQLSPIVTQGTVVIPRQCTIAMVAPVYSTVQAVAVQASGVQIKRGCGCRA